MSEQFSSVGIVGAGLVGCSWGIVFAIAGARVKIFDGDAAVRDQVVTRLRDMLGDMQGAGLTGDIEATLARISVCDSLAAAVAGVEYVQESTFERLDVKIAVANAIGAAIAPDTVVGSSSSGFPASHFTESATNRSRFLIAHPVNPPHLVPLVELMPAPWTDPELVPWLRARMEAAGQVAIVVRREVPGFILNRLQGALLNEAWALYDEGYASAEDIDAAVHSGLGLRWAFMGPFETIDLNAPGGIQDYAERFGPMYFAMAQSRPEPRPWTADLVARMTKERRAALPLADLGKRSGWRNRRLMALVKHLRGQAKD